MIISKINTEIETFCMDSDFRQSYPLIVFGGRGYDLDTQPCLFVPLFCLLSKTETIKKVLQYVDIVGLVSFLSPFGFVLMWSAWGSPVSCKSLIFRRCFQSFKSSPPISQRDTFRILRTTLWLLFGVKVILFFEKQTVATLKMCV